MKKLSTFIVSFLILGIALNCGKSPTEPDLDEEASLVPWSKITGKIAYSRYEDSKGYLFIIDGSTKKTNPVTESTRVMFTNLAWSNDGNRIVYSDWDENEELTRLYGINIDGSNQSIIYSVDATNDYPAYSRDGRLAYRYNGYLHIAEIWIDNSPFYNKSRCDLSRPAWSPDGQKIAFARGVGMNGRIFIMNSDGSDVTQVTQNEGNYPIWIQ